MTNEKEIKCKHCKEKFKYSKDEFYKGDFLNGVASWTPGFNIGEGSMDDIIKNKLRKKVKRCPHCGKRNVIKI